MLASKNVNFEIFARFPSLFWKMASSIKCVFCNSKSTNDKLAAFTVHTLEKCREVLDIRKRFNLKYNDVILPASECDGGYHVKFHKTFLTVMKKYYEKMTPTSDVSVQTGMKIFILL